MDIKYRVVITYMQQEAWGGKDGEVKVDVPIVGLVIFSFLSWMSMGFTGVGFIIMLSNMFTLFIFFYVLNITFQKLLKAKR